MGKQRRIGAAWILGSVAAVGLGAVALAAGAAAPAPALPDAAGIELFEKRVRPLLHQKCVSCHSGPRAQSGLDLKTRSGAFRGGGFGPTIVPGDPEKSVLIRSVRASGSLKMPPVGRLPTAEVALLEDWVRRGAPWPEATPPGGAKPAPGRGDASVGGAAARWAFQPVRPAPAPVLPRDIWSRTPVDRFLLARQRAAGLSPNPPADRHTLLRRVKFDLTGLPPTAEEIQEFVADPAPNAWAKVVDRLLASPAYGERWGRHWLDVARYSDSNGRDWNEVFAHAWRYRDWVIQAFNQDLPYNQFIRAQLAGDLLPAASDEERYERLAATGFLVIGPKLLAQQDRVQLALDIVDEQLDVTGKAFLGLTVGCARCHNHKFDPITAKDYYALAGIFNSTRTLGNPLPRNNRVMFWMERPLAPAGVVQSWTAHEQTMKRMQDASKKAKTEADKTRLAAEIRLLEAKAPPSPPMAMAVSEAAADRQGDMRVHLRGSYEHLGEAAPRGVPAVFGPDAQIKIPAGTSGRRELAEWIASPRNPLTARVLVNRVWRHHFGRGLVETPDDFGAQGERPTHPELLDWLAAVFVAPPTEVRDGVSGLNWSVKGLHRLLLRSQAYQMSSSATPAGLVRDGENRLLWRMNRRRLEAEALRDAMLAAAGVLDRRPGGTLLAKPSGFPIREFPVDFQASRRSVYLPVLRNGMYDFFQSFDVADPNIVMGRRNVTTVSTQALVMLNSPWVRSQAATFARRLEEQPGTEDERIAGAYRLVYGRDASAAEVARSRRFVEETARELSAGRPEAEVRREAWSLFCQALYASSEFRYVD
ncbi:MAG: DUF1549 domain-containing protein [Armatimonadetes bacterium]|nr:DUF1549 domain-containing protein [Armatimonadota bacterium]